MLKKRCLILFIKNPEKGKVKSRLSASLDEEIVLNLYKNFVTDLLEVLQNGQYTTIISYYPPESGNNVAAWLGDRYSYMPQEGKDLGERMKNAFTQVFSKGFSEAIIMGSDSPDLPGNLIDHAFKSFKIHDAVIGPTLDGGYYLIGFEYKTFFPRIFHEIEWGTETVFQKTMERVNKRGLSVHILPKWRDVDTIEDLKDLFARNKGTQFAHSQTMCYLLKYKEVLYERV